MEPCACCRLYLSWSCTVIRRPTHRSGYDGARYYLGKSCPDLWVLVHPQHISELGAQDRKEERESVIMTTCERDIDAEGKGCTYLHVHCRGMHTCSQHSSPASEHPFTEGGGKEGKGVE